MSHSAYVFALVTIATLLVICLVLEALWLRARREIKALKHQIKKFKDGGK
jgi:uncharacterized membrane protein YciS (DUF1049 family)